MSPVPVSTESAIFVSEKESFVWNVKPAINPFHEQRCMLYGGATGWLIPHSVLWVAIFKEKSSYHLFIEDGTPIDSLNLPVPRS